MMDFGLGLFLELEEEVLIFDSSYFGPVLELWRSRNLAISLLDRFPYQIWIVFLSYPFAIVFPSF